MRSPSLSSSRKNTQANGDDFSSENKVVVTPCCSNVALKRGPWTAQEDELLADYIRREGEGRWRTLPKKAGLLRCGKSCRLRWMNYLRPSVKRGHITPDEEDLILRLHRLLGNRWSLIAGRIPGRTDNEIKNYWNTHLSKKLISQGIDPKTHKPFTPTKPFIDISKNSSSETPKNNSSLSNQKNIAPFNPLDNVMANITQLEEGKNVHTTSNDEKLRNSEKGINFRHDDGDDDMINFCIDDLFLNSLINDDMFNDEHLGLEKNQHSDSLNILTE